MPSHHSTALHPWAADDAMPRAATDGMAPLSRHFLLAAALAGCAGMFLGIAMGMLHDFRLAPVHAHVNLLGWVSLALYGLFYQAVPAAADGLLPRLHFWLATIGPLLMCGSLAAARLGIGGMLPAMLSGAAMTAGGMLAFGGVVLRGCPQWRARRAGGAS